MTFLRGLRTEAVELAEKRKFLISKNANVRGSLHAPRTSYARPAHATAHVPAHVEPLGRPRRRFLERFDLQPGGVGESLLSLPSGFYRFSSDAIYCHPT